MSAPLETLIVHGLGSLRWMDGCTGDSLAAAPPALGISEPVPIRFDALPRGLRVSSRPGGLAFTFDEAQVVVGQASEADLQPPALAPFELRGTAGGKDASGRSSAFIPRRFKVALARGVRRAVTLYRSPAGTQRSRNDGALIAKCRAPDGRVVPWTLLTLTVSVASVARSFRAQADEHGDVVLVLRRLPPLPSGVTSYSAKLSVSAGPSLEPNNEAAPIDPDDLPAARLRALAAPGDTAQASIDLLITPGAIRRLESVGQTALIIEPALPPP